MTHKHEWTSPELSETEKEEVARLATMADIDIDFSDIPESSDKDFKRVWEHVVFISGGAPHVIERYVDMIEDASGQVLKWRAVPEMNNIEILTRGDVMAVLREMYKE